MFAKALRGLAASMLVTFAPFAATAQEPGDCADASYMETCPSQCAAACEDLTFFRENAAACARAFEADPAREPASCGPATPAEPVTLASCLAKASTIAVEESPLPDLRDIYTAFYSDLPGCALSPVALTEMYACLSGEAEIITTEFSNVERIEVNNSDPAEMLAAACRLKRSGTIVDIHGTAKGLSSRAEELTEQLRSVSDCRRSYTEWLGKRGEICSDSATTFDGCEIAISSLNLSIDQRLQTAKDQNDQIDKVLSALRDDLSTIMALTIIAGGIPAGDDCQ